MTSAVELVDAQQRSQALDITNSYIVQAPAGSGKTSILISRFICLLEVVNEPEEVLAVTFTKKATHEMRTRVLEALDPANGVDLHSEIANQALIRVQNRSQERNWDLLNQPSRLQIMTIDALCSTLVQRMPWASRLGSVPRVLDDALRHEVYRIAAANTIELKDNQEKTFREAIKLLLRRMDNKTNILQDLFISMLKSRDQWIRCVFEYSSQAPEDLKISMEETLELICEKTLAAARGRFLRNDLSQLQELAVFAAKTQEERGGASENLKNLIDLNDKSSSAFGTMVSGLAIAEILLTNDDEWRKRITIKQGFPAQTEEKDALVRLLKSYHQDDETKRHLIEVRYAPSERYELHDWECLEAILQVLPFLIAQLHVEFRNRGTADFIEIAQRASQALGTPENPTDLSLVLDYQFKHILFDEFQDTSRSQETLLRQLIGGWQSNDGRTLFLVGDPMQSIYRFREAEVGIFLDAADNGITPLELHPLVLDQNFRSNSQLVSWFNDTFEDLFDLNTDASLGAVTYSPCTSSTQGNDMEPVTFELIRFGGVIKREDARKLEADRLVTNLKAYLEYAPPSAKVAILLRSRNIFEPIREALRAAAIVIYGDNLEPLQNKQAVIDALSLTRALCNLADKISWLAILRAPWCGLELADLLVMAEHSNSIWEAMNDAERVQQLSPAGQIRTNRVREVLEQAFNARGLFGVRQLVEDTWTLLGGPACVSLADEQNVQLFFDLLENYSEGGKVQKLNQFEDFMDDLYAVPEFTPDIAQVHVMTIHAAKGLEFDAVFLPGMDRQPRSLGNELMLWEESNWGETGSSMLMSPISDASEADKSKMYNYLKRRQRTKSDHELERLIYVGCTRAKHNLYLSGVLENGKNPRSSTILDKLYPLISHQQTEIIFESPPESKTTSDELLVGEDYQLTRLPTDWIRPDYPAALQLPDQGLESQSFVEEIDFDWAGDIARWIGLVVHAWLQRISIVGIEQWNVELLRSYRNKWRKELQMLGAAADEIEDAVNRVEILLQNALEDPKGRWVLSNQHQESHSEWRLTGVKGDEFKNVIVDRTFVDEFDIRWIIDFKTGYTGGNVENFLNEEVKRYSDQLQDYGNFISQLDHRTIKLGLYFPAHKGWREWKYIARDRGADEIISD